MWCDITVRWSDSDSISTASSFSFNLPENPVWNCALFVNKFAIKWSEQRIKSITHVAWNFFKIYYFQILGSEWRQCKDNLALHNLWSQLFLLVSAQTCVSLSHYLHYMPEMVGGAKQAVMLKQALIFIWGGGAYPHYYTEHSTSCCFGRLPSI